eukprot:TRINITY_DN351_c0_g1_i1.p1 TRINITY_DN351_c0_g1~~TRINITY_DN351_c0_g1_i1.p1  ORF type:complete len:270 (-),score=36.90 TRINITY_DN351_c0_g1_i1:47-856(-)
MLGRSVVIVVVWVALVLGSFVSPSLSNVEDIPFVPGIDNGTLEWEMCYDKSGDHTLVLSVCASALIIIGLSMIFFGHKVVRLVAFLIGFCIFGALTYVLIDTHIAPNWILWGKLGVAGGAGLICGGLLAWFYDRLPIILGFVIGVLICSIILATPLGLGLFNVRDWLPLLSLFFGGAAGAVVGFIIREPVLNLASALIGSILVVYSIDCAWLKTHFTRVIPQIVALKPMNFDKGNAIPYVLMGAAALGTIVGFIFQMYQRTRPQYKEIN